MLSTQRVRVTRTTIRSPSSKMSDSHFIPPGPVRYPNRQFSSKTLKSIVFVVSPAPRAVKRQEDIVGAGVDSEKRISLMLKSNIQDDAGISVAVQGDQKKGHDPFVIKIKYRNVNGRMCEVSVYIANSLTYSRKDLHLQATSPGIVPFNWIATIPLCFVKYPVVTLLMNNKTYKHEVQTGNFEIKELKQGETYMVGVTAVDTLQKDDYFASKQTAEMVYKYKNVMDQLGRLENMLNISYLGNKKKLTPDCSYVLKLFSMCDDLLVSNERYNDGRLGTWRVDKDSTILDDVTCRVLTVLGLKYMEVFLDRMFWTPLF